MKPTARSTPKPRKRDVLAIADCYLHDPAYLVATYSRAELIQAALGFAGGSPRTIWAMSKDRLAKAISAQAISLKAWVEAKRDKYPRIPV